MTKTDAAVAAPAFNLSSLRAVDSIELAIKHPVTLSATKWVWTLAGPGHSQTLAHQEKVQRQRIHEDRMKQQAQVNGKKWKADEKDPDEIRRDNISGIASRVISFTPVSLDGKTSIEFSSEACLNLLLDPTCGWVLGQVVEALTDDAAFFPASAKA